MPFSRPAGINVRIDWGASFFANANADVTGRITSGIFCKRGRTTDSAVQGRTAAGVLEFELNNEDGLFDEEGTGALAGMIRPGLMVQLRDGGDLMWAGVLDSIPTDYDDSPAAQHRAQVTAWGVYSTLVEPTVVEGSLTPESTAQAFCTMLEGIDLCGLPVGTGFFTMPRWWETGSLRDSLHHIEDTEGGFIYEDAAGRLGIQPSTHRAAQSSSKTFTGVSPALPGEQRLHGRPKREIAVKDVKNQVVGQVREYAERASQTIFERASPVAIALGATVTLISDYLPDGAVLDIDTITNSDFTANVESDGTGNDRRAALTLSASIGDFNEILLEVVYPTGGSFTDAQVFLTSANIKGTVLARVDSRKVVRSNQESIDRYKLKTFPLENTWVDNEANMETRADALLDTLATPETRIRWSWIVDSYADFRSHEISDRVTIKMPGYTDDVFLENIALYIPLSRVVPVCTMLGTVAS